MLFMLDSVICFTSPRPAEKTMILILSQPLKCTSYYMRTQIITKYTIKLIHFKGKYAFSAEIILVCMQM